MKVALCLLLGVIASALAEDGTSFCALSLKRVGGGLSVDGTLELDKEHKFKCPKGCVYRPRFGTYSTCYSYGWYPPLGQCVKKTRCDRPPVPKYANIDPYQRWYAVGDSVKYICKKGYKLVGSLTNNCELTGKGYCGSYAVWSLKELPKCVKIPCGDREAPENGSVDPDTDTYEVDTEITFSCNKGYKLVDGPKKDKCLFGGKWAIGKDPKCEEIPCGDRDAPTNGAVDPDDDAYAVGTVITFSCDKGYRLVKGPKTDKCLLGGKWAVGKDPVCEEIPCGDRDAPDNGSVDPDDDTYAVGTVITFSCDKGYRLVKGPKTDKCLLGPKWAIGKDPICEEIPCGDRDAPANGAVDPDDDTYAVGTVITFSCDKGYRLVKGPKTDKCLLGPRWAIGKDPMCEEIPCGDRDAPTNGKVDPDDDTYAVGTVITFSCDKGYRLVRGPKTDKCLLGGKWAVGKDPECEEIPCGDRKDPINGEVNPDTPTYAVGTVITFTCNKGYKLVNGPKTDKCLLGGNWAIGKDPKCEIIPCGDRNAPTNGAVDPDTPTYAVGTVITFSCNKGYRLVDGPKTDKCLLGPQWAIGKDPKCELIKCKPEAPVDGGIFDVKPYYLPGGKISYYCKPGYRISGAPFNKCQDTGVWRYALPKCVAIVYKCPYPADLGKVIITKYEKYYSVGSTITYSCPKGYALIGGIKGDKCLNGGKWQYYDYNKIPLCKPIIY